MLKKIKLNNSTALLIGIVLICIGVSMGFIEYFGERKDKVYTEMNLQLYENEIPDTIESEEAINQNESNESENDLNSENQNDLNNNTTETKYNYVGKLEIPKINLERGFLDLNSKYNNVKYNITVIKGSTFPNEQNNNLILAAHSGVCSICYFDKLFKLSNGDKAYITYNNKKYTYKLVNTYEVEKDGTVSIYRDYTKNVLTLITCTKYSKTKQTVFIFELEE